MEDVEDVGMLPGVNPFRRHLEIEDPQPVPQPGRGARMLNQLGAAKQWLGNKATAAGQWLGDKAGAAKHGFHRAARWVGGKTGLSYSDKPEWITGDLDRFADAAGEQGTQQNLNTLYDLQRRMNRHIKESEGFGQELSPAMKGRMNQLQGHFQQQIGQLQNEGGALQVPGLSRRDQAEVGRLWTELNSADSNIQIDAGHHGPGFRNQIMTDFARMMPSATARSLLRKTQGSDHPITIRPHEGQDNAGARPLDPHSANLQEIEARNLQYYGKRRRPRSGEHTYVANEGGGSDVEITIPPHFEDSATTGYTKKNQGYTLPTYSVLAHELIHAKHHQKGTGRSTVSPAYLPQSPRPGHPDPVEEWHDYEEYHTIEGGKTSSNQIDQELGLPRRWDHRGTLHPSEAAQLQYADERHQGHLNEGYEDIL